MPKAVGPDPTIHRRRLRSELCSAREAAGMTQREVAAAMDWSQSKLIRIESGAVNIRTNDLRVLLSHYGTDSARIDALVDIARLARAPTPWSIYKDVASPEYLSFLGYESSASLIRNFEPLFVPALLQTEEYARAAISISEAHNPQKIDSLVDLRMQRQEVLVREPVPRCYFIMDEAVIRRVTGGRDVMRRQLRQLRTLAEYPNVTIGIVPFGQGIYPHLHAPYVLFEFPNLEDGDVLCVEYPQGQYIVQESSASEEGNDSPVRYLQIFWGLEQIARSEDTMQFLQDAIDRLQD